MGKARNYVDTCIYNSYNPKIRLIFHLSFFICVSFYTRNILMCAKIFNLALEASLIDMVNIMIKRPGLNCFVVTNIV